MDLKNSNPDNGMRSEEEQLDLGSLTKTELSFVVDMAHKLRQIQKQGIIINHYSVTADKFIIIMEHTSNSKEKDNELGR